jgi:hypothetical protein
VRHHLPSFSIELGECSEFYLEEDGSVLVIRLPGNAGEVRCSEYECEPHQTHTKVEGFLMGEMERYLKSCVVPIANQNGQATMTYQSFDRLGYVQMTACHGDGVWWIARLFSAVNLPSYMLMSWNGIEAYVKHPLLPLMEGVSLRCK